MKKNTKTIIEIKERSIKLLQMKTQKDGPCISKFDSAAVNAGEEDTLGPVLARMAAANGVDKENIAAVLPRRGAVLRQVLLPAQTEEELRKIVPLHLGQVGPFSRDDVFYDFSILERDDNGYARILLAVVSRKAVNRLLWIFQKAGLDCKKIVLSSYGIRNWLCYQQANGRVDPKESIMIIDLDRADAEICFIQQGRLSFSRNIPCGSADLEKGDGDLFVKQIELTLDACKKESWSPPIDRIVVVSSGKQGSVLKEILREHDSVPVVVHDPFYEIPCGDQAALSVSSKAAESSLTAMAGFLVDHADDGFDFIPGEVVRQREAALVRKAVVRLTAAAALCLVLASAKLGVSLVQKQLYLDAVNKQLAESQGMVLKAENKMEFLEFLTAKSRDRVFVADVLKELYLITPETVSFRSLDLRSNKGFDIEGYAEDQMAVNDLQSGLLASALFGDVKLQYATKRKRSGEEFTAFKISCQFRGEEQKDAG